MHACTCAVHVRGCALEEDARAHAADGGLGVPHGMLVEARVCMHVYGGQTCILQG